MTEVNVAANESGQIGQGSRCAGQGFFSDRDVELVNFLAILPDQALHHGRRNAGFVKQRSSCPT